MISIPRPVRIWASVIGVFIVAILFFRAEPNYWRSTSGVGDDFQPNPDMSPEPFDVFATASETGADFLRVIPMAPPEPTPTDSKNPGQPLDGDAGHASSTTDPAPLRSSSTFSPTR